MKYGTKLLKKIYINKLKLKIMKTLKKFECANCIIKVEMQTAKDVTINYKEKLYKVTTTPKRKNTWKEYAKEFNYSSDVNKYFLEEIKYWLI